MKSMIVFLFVLYFLPAQLFSEENVKYNYIGINPDITATWNGSNGITFDINIVPISYGRKFSEDFGVLISPIISLGFDKDVSKIYRTGLKISFPYSLSRDEDEKNRMGLFLAPKVSYINYNGGYSKSAFNANFVIGYDDFFKGEEWALTFALGIGASKIDYREDVVEKEEKDSYPSSSDSYEDGWTPSFAGMLLFGYWF
jgi:hypothetical protein